MSTETIFKFLAVRPAKLTAATTTMLPVYSVLPTAFHASVLSTMAGGATKTQIATLAKNFLAEKNFSYLDNFADTKFPVESMMRWVLGNGTLTFSESDFIKRMEAVAGMDLVKIVNNNNFLTLFNDLRDSVLACILSNTPVTNKEKKISAIKLLYTLAIIENRQLVLKEDQIINDYFSASTVLFPVIRSATESRDSKLPAVSVKTGPLRDEDSKTGQKLQRLEAAHRELSRMATHEQFRYIPEMSAEANHKEQSAAAQSNSAKTGGNVKPASADTNPALQQFLLSRSAVKSLSKSTQAVLDEFKVDRDTINPIALIADIEEEIGYLSANTRSNLNYNKMIAVGGTYIDRNQFNETLGDKGAADKVVLQDLFLKNCSYQSGIGDLLIVQQKLKAYELAEFAHVENALSGETREREHRRLSLREDITESETETETEKERNLQSAERNEMQNEAQKIIQQDSHLEAGLQVSGSYGPVISFSSSLNAGVTYSVNETQKKSQSYSREVTEKSSEKITNRVREQTRRRVLEQTEEINKHKIDNSDPSKGHLRGIYRWLNKVYDAQILNYGQRMMYEFVIPEPAAFFLYAMVENPPVESTLIKPEPPMYNGAPLTPAHLNRANYTEYISLYNVTGAPELPSSFIVKSYSEKQEGKEVQNFNRSAILPVPAGYEAYAVIIQSAAIFGPGDDERLLSVTLAGMSSNILGIRYLTLPRRYRGELSMNCQVRGASNFTASCDIFCQLTAEAVAKWQVAMYDAIVQAYLDQKAAYDARLEQKAIQEGVKILGRNPDENRRIEKEELKKLVDMVLLNLPYFNFNSFVPYPEPIMDLTKICSTGALIRFFENAFEWQNMTYVFYPYFWGRHARWASALHITDPDTDFAAFLKAGAARVQVPVRPGFERALALFSQTGVIWEGNDVPIIGDKLYVPLVDEISEKLGKLDNGVVYPEGAQPWEVTVPTSLIVLQDLEEIPNIRDRMTGNFIDLRNKIS